MTNEKIKNRESNLGIKLLVGGLFLAFGLATLKMYVGIGFLIISVIAITYATGIEINYQRHEIRPYTKYLWIVKGKWIKLYYFKKITIRKQRKGIRQYGGRSSVSINKIYTYFDVLLMYDHYKDSIILFTSRNMNKSQRFAEKWSEKLNIPFNK